MGDYLSLALGKFQRALHWRAHLLFTNTFHSDNGAGLGASHQPGWTGLMAKLIQQVYALERTKPTGILGWGSGKDRWDVTVARA